MATEGSSSSHMIASSTSVEPSKVLHIRNLPEEITELEIRAVAARYGDVHRILHISRKHQAFVEFKSFEESAHMLQQSQTNPIRLGTRFIIAQYSNKPEITTSEREGAAESSASKTNVNGGEGGKVILVTVNNIVYPVTVDCLYKVFAVKGKFKVDKIVIFTKQGKTQALVQFHTAPDAASALECFQNQNVYSGCNKLQIQYSHLSDVTVNYNNERTFDFTNSSLPPGDMSVAFGSPTHARGLAHMSAYPSTLAGIASGRTPDGIMGDFFNNGSRVGPPGGASVAHANSPPRVSANWTTSVEPQNRNASGPQNWDGLSSRAADGGGSWSLEAPVYDMRSHTHSREQRDAGVGWELQCPSDVQYSSAAVAYGTPSRAGPGSGPFLASPMRSTPESHARGLPAHTQHHPYGSPVFASQHVGYGGSALMASLGLPSGLAMTAVTRMIEKITQKITHSFQGGMGAMGISHMHLSSPVILVNNLDPERALPEPLFNLFSTCGTILRIKILYNKRDSALIQFESPDHADNARRTLSGCPLWGRNIIISQSKHSSVQTSRSDAEEESAKLFGDYSLSSLHRYRNSNSNQRAIPSIEPSKLLHVSNISPNITEDEIKAIFDPFGPVKKIKFISNNRADAAQMSDRKMCLVELPTVQSAAEALCEIHGRTTNGLRLRVSFSTSTLDGTR